MKTKTTKVLIINTAGMGLGGITIHMINYIEAIRRSNDEFEFTVVVTGMQDNQVIDKLINNNCNLIYLPDRKKDLLHYCFDLKKLLKRTKFDIIHIHGNSSTMSLELLLGLIFKIPKRIAHCHNSRCNHPFINKLFLPLFKSLYTDAVACSDLAGEWLFGKDSFIVLHNAINLEKFVFQEEIRISYRKELNINDSCLLIGHVGSMNEQKNHEFLIKVFYELQKQTEAHLVLIGEGYLKYKLQEICMNLNVSDRVHFLGLRNDVPQWLSAMDLFIFPSRWEGLGMVLIEAQASALPVLASTEVPYETCLTSNIEYLKLEDDINVWVQKAIELADRKNIRKINRTEFNDYDILVEKEKLVLLYKC